MLLYSVNSNGDLAMSLTELIRILAEKKGSLILTGIFVAALSFFLTTLMAPRFKVTTDFLIAQVNTTSSEFYTLFKSSEYIGRVLGESVGSERFINAVIETGKVSKEFLPMDKSERLKAWRQMVTVEKNAELGRLSVTVKTGSEREGGKIMQAINEVLMTKNVDFRGGDEKAIEMRILSGPITERNPSPKELILVIIVGFLAGVSLMAFRHVWKAIVRGY